MKNFLAFFRAFPSVLAVVQAVETAVPLPGAGKHKLDMVLSLAGTAWDATQAAQQVSKNMTLASVESLVGVVVTGLNASGVFKRTVPVSSN